MLKEAIVAVTNDKIMNLKVPGLNSAKLAEDIVSNFDEIAFDEYYDLVIKKFVTFIMEPQNLITNREKLFTNLFNWLLTLNFWIIGIN